jgi:hypothetical protein
MRVICMVLALCLPACGQVQGIAGFSGGSGFSGGGATTVSGYSIPGRASGIGSLQATLRTDPPSAVLPRGLVSSYRGHASSGESFFSRVLLDLVNHLYFGYELILEEQPPGTYLATFGKLGLTPMEAAASAGSKVAEWSMQALPAMPQPKVVHDGEMLSIELMTDAATGEKLIDDIEIQLSSRRLGGGVFSVPNARLPNLFVVPSRGGATVPTVDGIARDFSVADAEMRIAQPRVTVNGAPQSTAGRGSPNAAGSLVWFYLPGRGRYVLSLVPHPDLDFQKAGEVRGGAITFTLGNDTIKLECPNQIAAGNAPYNLYVLRDPEWEPTAQAQKGLFAAGSVDPGELAALKRK